MSPPAIHALLRRRSVRRWRGRCRVPRLSRLPLGSENAALAGDEGPEEGGAPTEDGGADSATGPDSAGQSGDVTGLEEEPEASSDSVEDLVETGQYYEAEVVEGIEDAPPADEAEVTTHERPAGENEDVPDEEKPGEQR